MFFERKGLDFIYFILFYVEKSFSLTYWLSNFIDNLELHSIACFDVIL
jgi:hypothetical protein